jgi:porin
MTPTLVSSLLSGLLFTGVVIRGEESHVAPESEASGNEGLGAALNSSDQRTYSSTNLFGGHVSPQLPVNLRPFLGVERDHFFNDWFTFRSSAENVGLTPTLTFDSNIAGNVTGGQSQGVTHADNLGLSLLFDFDKMASLEGGSFLASVSQRSGSSLSKEHVGNVFTIQQVYGGQTFHLIDLAYQQRLLDNRVEVRLGRIASGDDFLVSPYNWLFMQNGFDGNPVGIVFNSPGMTAYPNATWGAWLKVRPTERTYVMAGIYNGDPSIRDIDHNGADMSMNGPIFVIGEAGFQRNALPGDPGLLGNYRIGGWYDNSSFTDFNTVGYGTFPATKRGNWGVYTLDDQMLFSFDDPSTQRGLGICGSFLVSPNESISQMPYFFTAGIVARGVIPCREPDLAGFGIVYGHFSSDLQHAQEREQLFSPAAGAQEYESVLEWTYRFYYRKKAVFFQPDIQYVIRPGGTGKLDNALVLACWIGINF